MNGDDVSVVSRNSNLSGEGVRGVKSVLKRSENCSDLIGERILC